MVIGYGIVLVVVNLLAGTIYNTIARVIADHEYTVIAATVDGISVDGVV